MERVVSLLKPGDVAVFYYAGRGVQVDGENYLRTRLCDGLADRVSARP